MGGSKPVKSQGNGCVGGGLGGGTGGAPMSNVCPATRSTLERLCQARRARRAARRLREQQQQRHGPKVPSNLDILERHTMEVLKRLEVGPLEEVSVTQQLSCLRGLAHKLPAHFFFSFLRRTQRSVQRFTGSSTKCRRRRLPQQNLWTTTTCD